MDQMPCRQYFNLAGVLLLDFIHISGTMHTGEKDGRLIFWLDFAALLDVDLLEKLHAFPWTTFKLLHFLLVSMLRSAKALLSHAVKHNCTARAVLLASSFGSHPVSYQACRASALTAKAKTKWKGNIVHVVESSLHSLWFHGSWADCSKVTYLLFDPYLAGNSFTGAAQRCSSWDQHAFPTMQFWFQLTFFPVRFLVQALLIWKQVHEKFLFCSV